MVYRVEITPAAKRAIKKLPKSVQQKIIQTLELLAIDPRPQGTTKLSGKNNLYRVRIGNYRIIYQIEDEILLVIVTKVGHRREVYRQR